MPLARGIEWVSLSNGRGQTLYWTGFETLLSPIGIEILTTPSSAPLPFASINSYVRNATLQLNIKLVHLKKIIRYIYEHSFLLDCISIVS